MYIKLFLLLIVGIINVYGNINSTRIENDAKTWVELSMKYIQHPSTLQIRTYHARSCEIIRECCPEQRHHIFYLIRKDEVSDECIKRPGTILSNLYSPKCRSLIQSFYNLGDSDEVQRPYKNALRYNPGASSRGKFRRSLMSRVCTQQELEAYYCEPENKILLKSCVEKVLQLVARNDDTMGYDIFVREFENDFTSFYSALTKSIF